MHLTVRHTNAFDQLSFKLQEGAAPHKGHFVDTYKGALGDSPISSCERYSVSYYSYRYL